MTLPSARADEEMQAAPVELARRPAQSCPSRSPGQQGADRGLVGDRHDRLAGGGDLRRPAADPRHGHARRFRRPAAGSRGRGPRPRRRPRRPVARKLGEACGLPRCRSSSRAGATRRDRRRRLQQLGRAPRALQRAAQPLPADRPAPAGASCAPSASPAGLSGVSVQALQAAFVVPGGGGVAQQGEGHALIAARPKRCAPAAWAAARSS